MLESTLHELLAPTLGASAKARPGPDADDGTSQRDSTAVELPGGSRQVLRARPAVRTGEPVQSRQTGAREGNQT